MTDEPTEDRETIRRALIDSIMERLQQCLDDHDIPDYMHDGIREYVKVGRPTGGFLYAVFTNDLKGSAMHADVENLFRLHQYAQLLCNGIPVGAQGSERKVNAWIAAGGLVGATEQTADTEAP